MIIDRRRQTLKSKWLFIPILIVILLLTQNTVFPENKNMDIMINTNSKEQQFGRQLFDAFNKDSEALWLSLFPTDEEYKTLLQLMLIAKVDGLTQEKIEDIIKRRKEEAAFTYRKEFKEFQNQAVNVGVNWSSAGFSNFESEAIYPDNFPNKYLSGIIWFKAGGSYYMIDGVEAVEIQGEYKLQSIKRIRKIEY